MYVEIIVLGFVAYRDSCSLIMLVSIIQLHGSVFVSDKLPNAQYDRTNLSMHVYLQVNIICYIHITLQITDQPVS